MAAPTLQEAFQGKQLQEHGKIWDQAWKAKRTTWDRGGPSIALHETLNEYPELFNGKYPGLKQLEDSVDHGCGRDAASGVTKLPSKRKKALVPACGRGYDAVLLAYVFGYDVYALDISEEAVVQANSYLARLQDAFSGRASDPVDFPFWVENRLENPGHVRFVLGDFFSDRWMEEEKIQGLKFDLIFDYTFFCAIPPAARPKWASRMQQLLARPNGRLVCLEFPTGRDLKEGGPPYSAAFLFYQLHLTYPGNEEIIKYYEINKDLGHPETGEDGNTAQKPYYSTNMDAGVPYGEGFTMLARFKPRNTHEAGQSEDGKFGRDWVSTKAAPADVPVNLQDPKMPVDLVTKIGGDDEVELHATKDAINGDLDEGGLPHCATSITLKATLAIRGKERARVISEGSALEDTVNIQALMLLKPDTKPSGVQYKKSKTDAEDYEWDDIYSADAS
ncbi:putative thiol methyltransferase 2 [Cytospora mali]|uniref:Thiol methyltransferase 2 n=1 Tax=Cytospora mali TaxID=578113 RepID=A0A194WDT8_CYTMA|nr:putative thiol methyltransferase 2 [Valsa mali]